MTGFREQGSGIPLTLLHGISSGAASWHKQMALPGYRVLAWDMPGYGESPMLAAAPADAGDYADALARMLDRAGVEQTVLVGHSLGALVAAAFAAKYPQRVLYLVLADVAQGYGQAEAAQREKVWQGRQQQMALGGEAMAQGRAAKLLRPGAREADVATVAAGMRRLRSEGYLAAAWMLAHDDIHRWLADYRGHLSVWCGEQDAITQPELVQGVALRYGAPYIAIPQAGHASYLDNETFFNQQLLRIGEEVREGAKVAFCGRNPDRLASAHAALQNEYPEGEVFSWRCDVLNEAEVQAFADAVATRFGGADMLINNAGQGYVAHFADTPREAWLHEAELKLFGVINPVKAFQSQLEQSDIASITCVNSLLALQPEEHMIATSAARAALLNMTLTLSKELVEKGIRVNSILLGMVESGQWQRRFENRSDKSQSWPQWTADIARKRGIPMARLGKPQEPAQALLFLASPLASFITGAALDVSGGFCRHL